MEGAREQAMASKQQQWQLAYTQEDLDFVNEQLLDSDLAVFGFERVRTLRQREPPQREQQLGREEWGQRGIEPDRQLPGLHDLVKLMNA